MSKASEYMKAWRAAHPDRVKAMKERAKAKKATGGKASIIKKVCRHCGVEFTTTNRKQEFCTTACQREARNKREREARKLPPRECKVCHKMFQPVRPSHVCCSRTCSDAFHNSLKKERRSLLPPKLYTKICPCCNREFQTAELNRKACSDECAKKIMRKQNQAAYLAKHPNAGSRIRAKSGDIRKEQDHRVVRDSDGLTLAERNAVIMAQNGPRENLWKLSQSWTPAQRRFAKRRYESEHPSYHSAVGW